MRSFHHRDYFFHPCRMCGAAANLTRNTPAADGYEHRTYECRRCGHVDLFGVGPDDSRPWKVIGSADAQPM
ncbi:hypothetical protein Rpal_3850 [Rhodopseudomonas palustris TIE-1]|uniref:hypothetical protein n=1 Tax=Rhodopseudomonas palustris TaxID=1076 RepID=UPI000164B459|nr:hypothetical protein [Rhodopseudomonas palustris]ACF02348.1 hypothetical protein Rpal_3850 [Rhodopseudomonas palustris TIE-1]QLH72389.1 hypothetical protein HZF03_16960 [Rhodopseudomonas palustris]RIA02579.1 hypothetical protein D1920_06765 [Rhodopseudomonas palustris]